MRNYRFAIVQYDPRDEFKLRSAVQSLSTDLVANGWMVIPINLQQLLLDRVRAQGQEWMDKVIAMEERMASVDPDRGLNYVKSKLTPLIEGPRASPPTAPASSAVHRQEPRHGGPHGRAHRPRRRALPVLPLVGPAPPPRRQDRQRARRAALPGRASRAHGLSFMGMLTPTATTGPGSIPDLP
jgi:hypothetical protein